MNTGPRILIVEDDAILVMDLQNTLIRMGYQVIGFAATGEEAIEMAIAEQPDAILMDINLRDEMNGIQAAAEIQSIQDTPIIYLTAYMEELLLQQAKTTAYAYLLKPVRERELQASLEMALYKYSAEKRLKHLNQVLRALRDVNQLITREHDPQKLMDEACKILLRTRGYCFVWFGKSTGNHLVPLAFGGEGKSLIDKIVSTVTPEQGKKLPGTVAFHTQQVVVCSDMLHDDRYAPWQEDVAKSKFRSTIAIPMRYENEPFGVLIVYADQTNVFDEEEVDLLKELACDIAFCLKVIAEQAERKLAQEALRESEIHFRALSEDSLVGVYIIQNGLFTYTNPAMEKVFGYQTNELIGLSPLAITYPDDRDLVTESIRRRMDGEIKSIQYEFRGLRKDGEIRHVKALGVRVDLKGLPAIIGNIIDINKRKKTEEALIKSEVSYRGLFNTVDDAIYILDHDGHFLDVNMGAVKMYGHTLEYLVGKSAIDLSAPDKNDLDTVAEKVKLAFADIPQKFEFWGIRKNGEKFPKDVHLYHGTYFNQDVVIALARDISEQKRTELALLESEARLRAVVQTANDAIITINAQGDIVDWNLAAQTIFGFSKEEAIGKQMNHIFAEQTSAPQFHLIDNENSQQSSTAGMIIEATGRSKNGRIFPMEISIAGWKTQSDNFCTAFIRDISERKQQESELSAIAAVSNALRSALNRAEMLPVIVQELKRILKCDSMSIEIIDQLTGDTIIEAALGQFEGMIGFKQKAGTGINALISKTRKPYLDNNIISNPDLGIPIHWIKDIIAGAGVPLIAQEQLIGFLWIGRKEEISQTELRILATIADIAANAIRRVTLFEQTRKNATDLAQAYNSTLEGWVQALELRDQETEGHARRVVQLTIQLARELGFRDEALEHIRRGALLHDIGKMGIPDAILLKPGSLTKEEWEVMRQHPEYAYNLLKHIEYLRPVLDIPYYHHEKWDGSGYPRGLKGAEIPLAARIFAIIDVWDALVYDRPYRSAWSKEKTLAHIKEQSGKHFDPLVVEMFLKIME